MMLFAEVLSRAFKQTETFGVTRKDTASIITLLGPIPRMMFGQFSRVSVGATKERRKIILDAIPWQTPEVKKRFAKLPLMDEDMFGGMFDELLQEEATRRETLKKADLSISNSGDRRSRPFVKRGTSGRASRPRGCRGSFRGTFRGRESQARGRSSFSTRRFPRGPRQSFSRGRKTNSFNDYNFVAFSFRLSTAPRVSILAFPRRKGISVYAYIDD